jgi:hypothetical protein
MGAHHMPARASRQYAGRAVAASRGRPPYNTTEVAAHLNQARRPDSTHGSPSIPKTSLSGKLEALERGAEKSTRLCGVRGGRFLENSAPQPNVLKGCAETPQSGGAAKLQVLRWSLWATGLSGKHMISARGPGKSPTWCKRRYSDRIGPILNER